MSVRVLAHCVRRITSKHPSITSLWLLKELGSLGKIQTGRPKGCCFKRSRTPYLLVRDRAFLCSDKLCGMNTELDEIEADPKNGMSALTRIVVDGLISGEQFETIAEANNLPVVEVVRTWKNYLQNQQKMSREEQWALHLLRLESFLTKLHDRLQYSTKAEDYELVLKLLDKLEAMHALNETRKVAADEVVKTLSQQQGVLVMQVMFAMQANFKSMIEEALENKTIKAIKADLLDDYEATFTQTAQKALETVAQNA